MAIPETGSLWDLNKLTGGAPTELQVKQAWWQQVCLYFCAVIQSMYLSAHFKCVAHRQVYMYLSAYFKCVAEERKVVW